ncbi:hypothetical protein scyTo_0025421 [Scyliorhinus torazame]|uniref:Separin n=1 Tax=Scyliorhinus torazame TaxID=75743 RepID=A0A401QHC1_SCYTO|nr:hypothetical protein [Scyliorhinus torazame]
MANPAERPELRLTCDRIIRTCIQRLGEEEEEEKTCEGHLGTLLRLAELACEGYQACAPAPGPRQQLYLERLLFHLLKGAAGRGALEACLPLAERLRRGLELCRGEGGPPPRDVEAVAKNGLAVLWKGAEAAEEGARRLALTLRLSGLRLLALTEGPGAPPSSLPRKFGQACALYLKGAPSPMGDEDSAHLRREFESLLPGAGGCACELALQCCGALCRGGRPDVALQALTRCRALPAEGLHASAALLLCRLACGLGAGAGAGYAPSLAEAARALRSLPPGDPRQHRAVADACQLLLSALDGARLGLQGLLRLFDLLDAHFTALREGEKVRCLSVPCRFLRRLPASVE